MPHAYRVDEAHSISERDFHDYYVRGAQPVVMRGALRQCWPISGWTLDYLRERVGDLSVPLKAWSASGIRVVDTKLRDYVDSLEQYERGDSDDRPAYLHDVRLLHVFQNARADLELFPNRFFPSWYGADWTGFAQMFLGPSMSSTPLHFDCLLTHNLFFQVFGRKRFTLISHDDLKRCYPHNWRWCKVDAERPDFERYPLFRDATRVDVVVEAGDVLYMPPGTLHQVTSLDCALSFNVDWHTKSSALKGVLAIWRGMPLKNVYYNAVIAAGMLSGAPTRRVMPYYQSYLSYVS